MDELLYLGALATVRNRVRLRHRSLLSTKALSGGLTVSWNSRQ